MKNIEEQNILRRNVRDLLSNYNIALIKEFREIYEDRFRIYSTGVHELTYVKITYYLDNKLIMNELQTIEFDVERNFKLVSNYDFLVISVDFKTFKKYWTQFLKLRIFT